jgi:hypothetical protein
MRHIQYSILILLLIGSFSCYFGPHETIYGSGHVVTEERNIDDFTGLKVSSGIDVVIRQGKEISLELEADDNLHDVILTEVEGDVLKVYTEKNIRKARSKKVFLVYEELNSIRISSAGDARVYASEEFNLRSSSAGSIYYKGDGRVANSHTSSAGSIVKK